MKQQECSEHCLSQVQPGFSTSTRQQFIGLFKKLETTDLLVTGRGRADPGKQVTLKTDISAHLRNRFKTSSEISRDWRGNNQISRFTVARRLHIHGIKNRAPCQKKFLTPRHKVARLDFARRYVRWTMQQWMRVIFLTSRRIPSNGMMVARESGVARERGLSQDASRL